MAYIEHLEQSAAFYEQLSMDVFGREIPQVLLLHANLLNAEQVGRVVDMLAGRGYAFIGMSAALDDPAYAREDTYVGPRGLSWIQRWALEDGVPIPPEPREHAWVAEAFRAVRQRGSRGAAVRDTHAATFSHCGHDHTLTCAMRSRNLDDSSGEPGMFRSRLRLLPHDPSWNRFFEEESQRIRSVLRTAAARGARCRRSPLSPPGASSPGIRPRTRGL